MENTELYRLISRGDPEAFGKAHDVISGMSDAEVRLRHSVNNSTFLHRLVDLVPGVNKAGGSLTDLVPLVYRLALRGVNMNAQNSHGNTCLHLACIRPAAEALCQHFIRIGVDPCIMNNKRCRIIHTCSGHKCQIVKGQASAKSGIWNAIDKEDVESLTRLLKTWCRVNIRKNRHLKEVAEETSNVQLIKTLTKYENTNEIVMAAFSCDPEKVIELCKGGGYDTKQYDESYMVPRPLVVAVSELGEVSSSTLKALHSCGFSAGNYNEILASTTSAFEESDFYLKVETGTDESLNAALELLSAGSVNIQLISHQSKTKGWSFLHYIVDVYIKMKAVNEERARVLVRMLYRLALAGIDVNHRAANGDTALIKAAERLDQNLMTHMIRLGGDPSLKATDGRTVNEEVYENKGQLVFDKNYRHADLPGLWVAIESNDIGKAERWLKSWSRVNSRKGDLRMLDVARAMKRKEIVRLLEEYEHINEFVCATFACDTKAMMHLLALGKGKHKVNTIDDFFHVGYTWDRHAEFMPRPIIISAMEICDTTVVDFLLNFGANLSNVYEECAPCGPIAFWAFRDHVDNGNALVVARHADVTLRDELGCSMLHKAIQKNRPEGKLEILQTLLDAGIDVASRDYEGSTARDYIDIYNVENGQELSQAIDSHVLELVATDQYYHIETLLVSGYDHIMDIHGSKKHTSAREIAELKELKEMLILFDEFTKYKNEIEVLHEAAKNGDLMSISKLAGEKRCAWSRDKAGRTLLHCAVLYEHPGICKFLIEQHPNLINLTDNLLRTPLHYCVCLKERQTIWPILQDGGADPNLIDANNFSVYDYVRELETPTFIRDRSRGRRVRGYRPETIIQFERKFPYGAKTEVCQLVNNLLKLIPAASLADIEDMTSQCKWPLTEDAKDADLLKVCIDEGRLDIVRHLVEKCGARPNIIVKDDTGSIITAKDYAVQKDKLDIAEFLKSKN